MGADGLSDVASAPELGVQLDRLEPADVLGVEEHPAHDHLGLVALERVARQHHLLKDDAVGVSGE